MRKDLSYNYELIDLKDYKPVSNFISSKNDIALYSIYRFINNLKKITKVKYEIKVTYSVVEEGYDKTGEIFRKIDVKIFMEEIDDKKIESINKIIASIQDENSEALFSVYNNDFISILITNNHLCIYNNYGTEQNYKYYEYKLQKLIDINKSNFKDGNIRFLVSEYTDKITGKVYKTNMTQILDLFYKLLEENKIEFIEFTEFKSEMEDIN